MKFRLLINIILAVSLISLFSNGRAEDNRYQIIEHGQPMQSEGKIEVVEFFWYGCPHCYSVEPYLEHWKESIPDDVTFRRIPGVLGSNWIPHARAFYTAEKLGVLDEIHRPLFDAIHKDRERIDSQKHLAEFFAEYDVDKAEFNRIYESEEITEELKLAFLAAKNYGIGGVPTIIVNGKFRTSASLAGGNRELITTVNDLIEKSRNNN